MRRTLTLALSLGIVTAQAQLVFIPDVDLRTWFNGLIPGCVDGAGYLDTSLPQLATMDQVALSVTWTPSDLTGLEYFTAPDLSLSLFFFFNDPGPALIPAWPPQMRWLEVDNFPGTVLPPLPATLEKLDLDNLQGITDIPALPAALTWLELRTLPIASLPPLPNLCVLWLTDLPDLDDLLPALTMSTCTPDEGLPYSTIVIKNCPSLPQPAGPWTANTVDVRNLPWTGLPALDISVGLFVVDMPLQALSPLPQNLETLYLENVPMSTLDLPPTTTHVDLINVGLTDISSLPSGLDYLKILHCPNITGLPPAPTALTTLWIDDSPILTTLPSLAATSLELVILATLPLLDEVPVLPPSVRQLALLHLALIDSLNMDSWNSAEYDGLYWDVADLPLLSYIKDLPGGWILPSISNCPALTCLPALDDSLYGITITNTGVTCLPNYPPSWFQNGTTPPLPLCNVFTSSCPVIFPVGMGEVFDDANANGVLDVGEQGFPASVVEASPGGFLTMSDNAGWFEMDLDTATFTVNVIPPLYHIGSTAPQQTTFTSYLQVDTLDPIGLQAIPGITDLVVDVTTNLAPVPGFDRTHHLTVFNRGTTTTDATIQYAIDPLWQWIDAVPAPDQLNGSLAQWSITGFAPGATWTADVHLNLPGNAPVGTDLYCTFSAIPAAPDTTPQDNIHGTKETVVASLDPNDKTVEPATLTSAEVSAGGRLDYTIRFQNTGNYPASRVIITDTLSTDLQWNTITVITSSHPCTWYIHHGVLHFIFDPINLPDSTNNEPESHGFVKFSMMPLNTLLNGAQIPNVANIVFDFNTPVITPPAVFTVDDAMNAAMTFPDGLTVYPNPAHDVLVVETPEAGYQRLDVLDMLGRQVLTAHVNGARTQLSTAALPAGTYVLRLQGQNDVRSLRFVRE